jgi:hypothetical protein
MTTKVIPFPQASAAQKDSVLLIVRRSIVIKVGSRQFTVDMTAKVRPLSEKSTPITGCSAVQPISSINRKQTPRSSKKAFFKGDI